MPWISASDMDLTEHEGDHVEVSEWEASLNCVTLHPYSGTVSMNRFGHTATEARDSLKEAVTRQGWEWVES